MSPKRIFCSGWMGEGTTGTQQWSFQRRGDSDLSKRRVDSPRASLDLQESHFSPPPPACAHGCCCWAGESGCCVISGGLPQHTGTFHKGTHSSPLPFIHPTNIAPGLQGHRCPQSQPLGRALHKRSLSSEVWSVESGGSFVLIHKPASNFTSIH